MIPVGAVLVRIEPHLKGHLRVYEFAQRYYTMYMTEKQQEAHELQNSPHRAKAIEILKKRLTLFAPDDSRKPCH